MLTSRCPFRGTYKLTPLCYIPVLGMSIYLFSAYLSSVSCSANCQNGGTCLSRDVCRCLPGYLGNLCQYPVCDPPCLNGGQCSRPGVCLCVYGWRGDRCQFPHCRFPCLNGGRCVRPNQCTCVWGYYGLMCHKGNFPLLDPCFVPKWLRIAANFVNFG